MNNKKISTILPDGTIKEFDVILTFKNNSNGKDYIVYTDNSLDNNSKLRIYASIYNLDSMQTLGEPETKEEWDEIYRLLDSVILDK